MTEPLRLFLWGSMQNFTPQGVDKSASLFSATTPHKRVCARCTKKQEDVFRHLLASFRFAEREGFEPPVQLPVHRISSAARSTTPAPFLVRFAVQMYEFIFELQLFQSIFCTFFAKD